ncbi:hypothetical protein ZIOFF_047779 [Zingiber officinale]|uniref:Uncharacterized protein n=1 Tax=Zingiber officinale TaxID=94328 RepID=A0A8J5KRC1_ZINOF|nr:hypothetical protein ZIOFF_047779 [Zingiber officinale]
MRVKPQRCEGKGKCSRILTSLEARAISGRGNLASPFLAATRPECITENQEYEPRTKRTSAPAGSNSRHVREGGGGFATEADADASGSTSTEDQASYASASFAAPFPDAQPTR